MAYKHLRIVEITTIASTVGVLYTNAADRDTYIRMINIHNSNTTDEKVTLYKVPDVATAVGTAGDTNIFYEETITAGGTVMLEYGAPGLMLEDENETIQAVTDTDNKVTIEIVGGYE